MSNIKDHIKKSIINIKKKHPTIYEENKEILEKIISELHGWFDYYDGKKGEDYDYAGIDCMKHREQRHHIEGVREAIDIFSEKYKQEFSERIEEFIEIIQEEGIDHIKDDMGCIYFRQDYQIIGFWKEIRGF